MIITEILKFLTNLSDEEHSNWKLSIKLNLLLMIKLKYFSNPLGITYLLRLNLPSSCMIRWESYFFRLLSTARFLWFNLKLMLQSLRSQL